MSGDMIRETYMKKVVVIEIDQRSKPPRAEFGEAYIGRVVDYDGRFVCLAPYVVDSNVSDFGMATEGLEARFKELNETQGNMETPPSHKNIAKDTIASIRLCAELYQDETDDDEDCEDTHPRPSIVP